MDKNKICEALYALPGNVVVKRRKFQLLPAVLFVAGAALIVVNNMYGADLTNNLRSSIVFIGGIMVVAGMIMAAAQMFGSGGAPFHREERCFLLYEELYFDRGIRSDVMQAVSDGDAERLLGMKRAQVPALTVALYRTPGNRFAAMQAFEYADLEYKPLTELEATVQALLKDVHDNLYAMAEKNLEDNTFDFTTWEEVNLSYVSAARSARSRMKEVSAACSNLFVRR